MLRVSGESQMLTKEMRLFDDDNFVGKFRLCPEKFQLFLSWVAPLIWKSSMRLASATAAERLCVILRYCVRRASAAPSECLCVILRYFATGDANFTIELRYRIGASTT